MNESSRLQSSGSVIGCHTLSSQSSLSITTKENNEFPLLILTLQPDSHNFNERRIILNDIFKIGRSVARARPCEANAIFDCKVLSRNHAIFWYDNGKVWLKDTKSSNGTFVNSQLLSKGTEDSAPREIYSGDIIQFGVEVVENTTTHGCIIAQTTIFLADGNELRRISDIGNVPSGNIPISNYYEEQIYQLAQYIQEASHREQTLEKKLNNLSQLIIDTQEASDSSWKVILNQDRLMEKLELLQEQVDMYAKGDDRDSLTVELNRVLEQRYSLESESKNLLEGLIEEKSDLLHRMVDLEQLLSVREVECSQLRATLESLQSQNGHISERLNIGKFEVEDLHTKLQDSENKYESQISQLSLENELMMTRYGKLHEETEVLRGRLSDADNELSQVHQTSIMKLDCLNQCERRFEESSMNTDINLSTLSVDTPSDFVLDLAVSKQEILKGINLIGMMKEEVIVMYHNIVNQDVELNEGNLKENFQNIKNLFKTMEDSYDKIKALLLQIPDELLKARNSKDAATNNALQSKMSSTTQTDLVTLVHSPLQYSVNKSHMSTQVDFLSPKVTEKIDYFNQSLKNLEQERVLNESLKLDLLHLQAHESFTVKQDMDMKRENIQKVANEGYNQLYQESQDLRKRVQEIEEEMVQKRYDYDILFEQYEQLIAAQTNIAPDIKEKIRVLELEELCLRQKSEIDEMRDSVSCKYQTILTRSRKINRHSTQSSAFLSSLHLERDGSYSTENREGILSAPLLLGNMSWSKSKLND